MADSNLADLTEVKKIIDISDTSEDAILTNFKESVDREIDNWMKPYRDTIPFVSGELTEDLIESANMEVTSRWFAFIKNYKSSDFWHKKYMEIKESIITQAKATPSAISKFTSVTKAYLSSPLKDE